MNNFFWRNFSESEIVKKFKSIWLFHLVFSIVKYVLLFLMGLVLTVSDLLVVLFYFIFFLLRALFVFRSAEALYRYFAGTYSLVARRIFDLEVQGKENLPKDEGFVVTLRHRRISDIPLVMTAMKERQLTFWARNDVFRLHLIPYIRKYVIFIDRRNSKKAILRSFRKAVEILENGRAVVVFPEGSRKEGQKDIKAGALRLARKANVKILPMNIEFEKNQCKEGQNLFSRFLSHLLRTKGIIKIGKPLLAEQIMDRAVDSRKKEFSYKDPKLAEFLLEEIVDRV